CPSDHRGLSRRFPPIMLVALFRSRVGRIAARRDDNDRTWEADMSGEHDLRGRGTPLSAVFQSVLERRLSRRRLLGSGGALAAGALVRGAVNAEETVSSLGFTELPHGLDQDFAVAEGYRAQVLLRWGDPIFAD